MRNFLFYCFLIFILVKCVPANEEPLTEVNIDVEDAAWQKIFNYSDTYNLDSLLLFTSHPNPSYRYIVANGLASIRDKSAIDSLEVLLNDPVMKVRVAAAYALGQLKDKNVSGLLLKSFKSKDTLSVDTKANATILESIGKTGGPELLKSIATVSTYRSTDTLLLLGQARAIYRYGLRGITVPEGTDMMVQYLTNKELPDQVRLVAANYLQRAKELNIESFKFRLSDAFLSESNPNIRMALASIIGKTNDKDVLKILLDKLDDDPDYRVKVNIIRSLGNFPYINVVEPVLQLLRDENIHVATTAADFLINHGNRNDAVIYRDFINDSLHYAVNAKLYAAILKHIPVYYTNTKKVLNDQLLEKYSNTKNVYQKSAYLTALSRDPYNYLNVDKLLQETNDPILKTAGLDAIHNILKSDNFIKAHGARYRKVQRLILDVIKREANSGDAGATAVAGNILSDPDLNLKELVDSTDFIKKIMEGLSLPQEIESYNSLKKAYDFLNGEIHTPTVPENNHSIDFSVFSTYGDSLQAAIKTNAGVIRLDLYPHLAAGSVANFVKLAEDNFYDNKVFHRVVPNFVVQAGCPRGDGYGSLDYTIRSEVSQAYYDDGGYIGMASAGPNTEGTQWFITHSPTMHLDGNYTIFGKVVEGMDTVHKLEVGDKILDIIITKK